MESKRNRMRGESEAVVVVVIIAALCAVGVIIFGIWALSKNVEVWSAEKTGQAELARAAQNRQIAVNEASAKAEASKLLAVAEIERAKGVAEANRIIGDSLKNNDGYLRYLWLQGLQTNQMQVVYVPTEANLPIMESTRLRSVEGK